MSKTMSARIGIRRQLLTTVSAAALLTFAYGAGDVRAAGNDTDRPVIWIEGGWHYEQASGLGNPFDPSFVPAFIAAGLPSPLGPQKELGYSYGAEGKISFQPENSDWIFSAAVRYGRSHGHKRVHQEIPGTVTHFTIFGNNYTATALNRYAETSASNAETHIIADFQAGRDVGLGIFSSGSTSTLSLGVRFAQFHSRSDVHINGRPDVNFVDKYSFGLRFPFSQYHAYVASAHRENSFEGIGPSISWNNSTPLIGSAEAGEIALDWGANAALLFGRQRTKVHHQQYTQNAYLGPKYATHYGRENYTHLVRIQSTANPPARNRTVMVPNLGGFAGLSLRYADAKLSLGYRADFFFGAMDGGLDTRKTTTRGFYGPFASISIGVGD